MKLSSDQQFALDRMIDWYRNREGDFLSFGGVAGCGKTTILAEYRSLIYKTYGSSISVAHLCFTGKAASVLREKLKSKNLLFPDDYCGTIHSAIYEPIVENDEVVGWQLKEKLSYALIIIDEASMVYEKLFNDLKSYNIPILACGDHHQLDPVGDTSINLVQNPDIKLEKVHRFAENNPLIKISILAREEGYIPHGRYGQSVCKVKKDHPIINKFINNSGDFSDTAILCGFNKTRLHINEQIRKLKKRKGLYPFSGERVICLKNNKDAKYCPIYNGVLGTVSSCFNHGVYLEMEILIDGESKKYIGDISINSFNSVDFKMNEFIEKYDYTEDTFNKPKKIKKYLDYFDYGYALTVHKSQGSEWNRVLVIEQPCQYWSGEKWNRWLYTAITRSKKELLIVR